MLYLNFIAICKNSLLSDMAASCLFVTKANINKSRTTWLNLRSKLCKFSLHMFFYDMRRWKAVDAILDHISLQHPTYQEMWVCGHVQYHLHKYTTHIGNSCQYCRVD